MSTSTMKRSIPFVVRQDARRRAVELYQTTNMKVRAIAAEVGVSRGTVYSWLRTDRVLRAHDPGGTANTIGNPASVGADVAELRRDLTILIAQVGRMEGLLAALTGLRERTA